MVGLKESLIDMGSYVELTGRGTRADAISRAVARDRSTMYLRGKLVGQHNESRGHLDCRGMLLSEHAKIHAIPDSLADSAPRSQLSHESAVGPIAVKRWNISWRGASRETLRFRPRSAASCRSIRRAFRRSSPSTFNWCLRRRLSTPYKRMGRR